MVTVWTDAKEPPFGLKVGEGTGAMILSAFVVLLFSLGDNMNEREGAHRCG